MVEAANGREHRRQSLACFKAGAHWGGTEVAGMGAKHRHTWAGNPLTGAATLQKSVEKLEQTARCNDSITGGNDDEGFSTQVQHTQ